MNLSEGGAGSVVGDEEDGKGRDAAAPAAAPGLPCLFQNNSDDGEATAEHFHQRTAPEIAAQRKVAHALAENVAHFIATNGIERCGFFTITFDRSVRTPKEAQRRFNNFMRRVVGSLFPDRIRVLEPHKDGRPHYHLIVLCAADIRTGFDWEHYEALRSWSRNGRHGPRPRGSLQRTALLSDIHRKLNEIGPRYGIGRMELTPIKSTNEAVGRYVGGYIAQGAKWRNENYKGARWVSYSRRFQRRYKGAFAWTDSGREWRRLVSLWAEFHGCKDFDAVKSLFGPRWAYHHAEAITQQTWTKQCRQSPACDGLKHVLEARANEKQPDSPEPDRSHLATDTRSYHLPASDEWRFKTRRPPFHEERKLKLGATRICT